MTRKQVVEFLAEMAGPLGPFGSLEERLQQIDTWAADADDESIDLLVDIVLHPPDPAEYLPATRDDFDFVTSKVLTLIGKRNTSHFLQRVGPLLVNERVRAMIIEVIGNLQSQEGISWLRPLLERVTLTEDELTSLASALGEIGGPEARILLEQMRASVPKDKTDVLREIDIALQTA